MIMPLLNDIIKQLESAGSEANRQGMQRYGIEVEKAFGVPLPFIRSLAKAHRMNHSLALQLWETGIHEARMMATLVDDPLKVTLEQMEQWVLDFNSWDICDQCCSNLFDKTPFALQKISEWTTRDEEFVRRAGFVMMACLAVHDRKLEDDIFKGFLPMIIENSTDPRNFVRKALNWALRQIGKRNQNLYNQALLVSQTLMNSDDKTARWIGSDAYCELMGQTAINRMKRSQEKFDKRKQ
jgi:3-methyladenine DNA glycosylase AlkD